MIIWQHMKKLILSWFSKKDFQSPKTPTSVESVVDATNITLDRYAKTFKDLARYDKGEKVLK